MPGGEQGRKIQRGLGVALWRQVADGIRAGLQSGLADATGRLPTEAELASRFAVNRHTVRAAIAALVHEGVLRAEQGRGTFVRSRKKLSYPIQARTRFSAGLESQARDRRSALLSACREAAPARVAEALGLPAGHAVIRLETLSSADDVAVSCATSWFPAGRFSRIAEVFARLGSISASLAELGIPDYLRASTAVEARHADDADVQALRLSPGAIVLVARALNVDLAGEPMFYSESRFAADRVELVINNPACGGPVSQSAHAGSRASAATATSA